MLRQMFRMMEEDGGHERCHSRRHGFGGHEGGFGEHWPGGRWFGRGFGGARERMFDAGDIRLVILRLLSEQPSYGYQLIKTMEERLAGGYSPSAGVIYPTLTMLEEEGLAASAVDNGKKVFSVTPQGLEYLESHKQRVEEMFARLEYAGRGFRRGRSPELMHAFMHLGSAVTDRVRRENVGAEQLRQIADAIHAAAKTIEEL